MITKQRTIILSVLIAVVITATVFVSAMRKTVFTDSRITLDTVVAVNVVTNSGRKASKAFDAVYADLDQLGKKIDFYSEQSEVHKINANAGLKAVEVSPETLELIKESLRIADTSGGSFDPTTGAVTVLWDFVKKERPDKKELAKALKLVSYKNVKINEEKKTVFLTKKNMKIDLGGIAKGYAADRAVDILKKMGVTAALVAVAGDIRAYGVKPDGRSWKVGIQDPRPEDPSYNIFAALPLENKAISTSGDYQRFFEVEGVRYHHILDPQTGMPARGAESVSVIAEKAVDTDSLSTAVFVLGPRKGVALLKKLGYEGVIVNEYGKILVTEGIKDIIEIKRADK